MDSIVHCTWVDEKRALHLEVATLKLKIEEMEAEVARLRNNDPPTPTASLVEDEGWIMLTATPVDLMPFEEPSNIVAVEMETEPPSLSEDSSVVAVPSHVVAVVEEETDVLSHIIATAGGLALIQSHHNLPLTTDNVTHLVCTLPWGAGLTFFLVDLVTDSNEPVWEIHLAPAPAAADQITFRCPRTGLYLCAEPNGHVVANRHEAREWEWFRAVPRGDGGKYAFQSCHGTFLCAEPGGAVVCNRHSADAWETFTVSAV